MIENYVMLAEWLAKPKILFNINQKAAGINYNYHGACSIFRSISISMPYFPFHNKNNAYLQKVLPAGYKDI